MTSRARHFFTSVDFAPPTNRDAITRALGVRESHAALVSADRSTSRKECIRDDWRRPRRSAFDGKEEQIALVDTQSLSEAGTDEGAVPPVTSRKRKRPERDAFDGHADRNLRARTEELRRAGRQLEAQPSATLSPQRRPESKRSHEPILPRATAWGKACVATNVAVMTPRRRGGLTPLLPLRLSGSASAGARPQRVAFRLMRAARRWRGCSGGRRRGSARVARGRSSTRRSVRAGPARAGESGSGPGA